MCQIRQRIKTTAALALLVMLIHAQHVLSSSVSIEGQPRKNIAEPERDASPAERDSPRAGLDGTSSDTLPKGEVKPQTLVIESTILGYRAAAEAARIIAQSVKAATATNVVFFSAEAIAAIAALRAFELQATTLNTRVAALLRRPSLESDPLPRDCKRAVSTAVTPSVSTADAALQLLTLTKLDRTATGASVTLDEFTLYALVSLELKSVGIAAAYPALYHPAAFQGIEEGSHAEQILNGIVNQQASLDTAYVILEKLKVQVIKRLASEKRGACKPLFQADISAIEERLTQMKTIQGLLDQFVAAALKPREQSGMTFIQSLNVAERLGRDFASAHVLHVKPIAAGGTTHTKTGLFGSTTIFFSAGVVISYMLADSTGALTAAGAIPIYEGFVKAEDMPEMVRPQAHSRQR